MNRKESILPKRLLTSLTASAALAAGLSPAAAQSTSTAQTEATVLQPLSFIVTQNLDFGQIIASNQQGYVTLAPDGTRTSTNGIVLVGSRHAPATFAGYGAFNQTVLISLQTGNIWLTGPGTRMLMDSFVIGSTPTAPITTSPRRFRIVSPSGLFEFPIGARLRVNANQARGVYNGTFRLTLNYE